MQNVKSSIGSFSTKIMYTIVSLALKSHIHQSFRLSKHEDRYKLSEPSCLRLTPILLLISLTLSHTKPSLYSIHRKSVHITHELVTIQLNMITFSVHLWHHLEICLMTNCHCGCFSVTKQEFCANFPLYYAVSLLILMCHLIIRKKE